MFSHSRSPWKCPASVGTPPPPSHREESGFDPLAFPSEVESLQTLARGSLFHESLIDRAYILALPRVHFLLFCLKPSQLASPLASPRNASSQLLSAASGPAGPHSPGVCWGGGAGGGWVFCGGWGGVGLGWLGLLRGWGLGWLGLLGGGAGGAGSSRGRALHGAPASWSCPHTSCLERSGEDPRLQQRSSWVCRSKTFPCSVW